MELLLYYVNYFRSRVGASQMTKTSTKILTESMNTWLKVTRSVLQKRINFVASKNVKRAFQRVIWRKSRYKNTHLIWDFWQMVLVRTWVILALASYINTMTICIMSLAWWISNTGLKAASQLFAQIWRRITINGCFHLCKKWMRKG